MLLGTQTVQTAAMVSLGAEAVGEVLILQDITLDMVALVYLVRQVAVVVVVQDRITLEQQAVDGLTIFPQMGQAVELMVDKLLHMAIAVVLVVVTVVEEEAPVGRARKLRRARRETGAARKRRRGRRIKRGRV